MNKTNWDDTIAPLLTERTLPTVDAAGATHLTLTADSLAGLGPGTPDAVAAANALARFIETPPLSAPGRAPEYWRRLCYLIQYLPSPQLQALAPALRLRLLGPAALDDLLKPHLLNTLMAAGVRLTPRELVQDLERLQLSAPIAWLNAAVLSAHYQLAEDTAVRLLSENALEPNGLILSLEQWRQEWKHGVDFSAVVARLGQAATKPEYKAKLLAWLQRRGYYTREAQPAIALVNVDTALQRLRRNPNQWASSAFHANAP